MEVATPHSHTLAALHALSTLPSELRACIDESMTRDARSLARSPHEAPIDPSRVSMTSHLREVLLERGMMPVWRRHFEESRFAILTQPEARPELAPICGEFVAVPA